MNVGGARADHGAPARQRGLQRDDVGAGAVEDGEDFGFGSELPSCDIAQLFSPGVGAVGGRVADIRLRDRSDDLGVCASVVV